MNAKEIFSEIHFPLTSGKACAYFVYPQNQKKFDRVLIYLHGLVSDIHWFEIPNNLPKGTGILFLPRQPRVHAKSFEEWTQNYEECFQDFKRRYESRYFHVIGHCFGALPALHWASIKPENFTTLTLVSPPFELKNNFNLKTKLGIFFGAKEQLRRSRLTPRHFSRLPELTRFIENNPTTTFHFSNAFFLETQKLRNWLKKNVIYYPIPTHFLLSSEDAIVKLDKLSPNGQVHDLPEETTYLYSDHYTELSPNKNLFWDSVFNFVLKHETKYEIHGKIGKILITGATGFVGSHIVRKLVEAGRHVIILVRAPAKARKIFEDILDKIELREGDLDHLVSIEKALEGIDAVIHTAAHVSDWDKKEKFAAINVEGTKNLLMTAHSKGIKQFVHISSMSVFGDTDQFEIDENHPYTFSPDPYSNSKIHAEVFVKRYCHSNQIPFTIIRPGFIYGEGDNNFFPNLIKSLKGRMFKYVGSKENILNAVYVGNIAALANAVIENPKSFGETYNLSDSEHVKIGKFIPRVAKTLGLPEPHQVVPLQAGLIAASVFEALFRMLRMKSPPPVTSKKITFAGRTRSVNAGKAYHFLGHIPFTYEQGIQRTLEHFKHVSGTIRPH